MTSYRIFIFVVTVAAVLSLYLQTTDARIRRKKVPVAPPIPVKSCKVNADCEYYEKCVDGRQCRHACYENLCSPPKYCTGRNHTHSCDCSLGRVVDGFVACQKYCEIDYHCDKGDKCMCGLCSPADTPQQECKEGCNSHDECAAAERCNDQHQCELVCKDLTCGGSGLCTINNHTRQCLCPRGQIENSEGKCVPKP